MARRKNPLLARRPADENMVVSNDQRSLRRGRRATPRTEVCRPCLVWRQETPENKFQAVVLDLNPQGMRIRSLDPQQEGTDLIVQMMRDEEFLIPLSAPITVRVMRVAEQEGFFDLGVRLVLNRIRRPGDVRLARVIEPKPLRRIGAKMHTVDYAIDEQTAGRTRR